MEGLYQWKWFVCRGLVGIGSMILMTQGLRAEMAGGAASLPTRGERHVLAQRLCPWTGCEEELPCTKSVSQVRGDDQAPDAKCQRCWDDVLEAVTESLMESMMTMFFIRWGSPPPALGHPQGDGSVPKQPNGGGPLPPPLGQGDFQPGDPGIPPPPVAATPEPSSMVIALVGAVLACVAWRKWRVNRDLEVKTV